MFKLISLGLLVAMSSLSAALLDFPLDVPVLQTSEVLYTRNTDDRSTMHHDHLKAILTLKDRNEDEMMFEAFYLNIIHRYRHTNDNLGYSESQYFNSENPNGKQLFVNYWNQLGHQFHLINVTPEVATSTSGKQIPFFTYQNNALYQGYIRTLSYVEGKGLEVGDSFFVHDNLEWNYHITKVTETQVHYTIKVEGSVQGQGHGYWERNNGLCGHLFLRLNPNGWASWIINLVGTPNN